MDGHIITINNNDAFNIYDNTNVTLVDTNEDKGSIITTPANCSAIWIGSSKNDASTVTIYSGITLTGTSHAICFNKGTVTVDIYVATLNGNISEAEGTHLNDHR